MANEKQRDLISRAALFEDLRHFAPDHYSALVNTLIQKQTAVDAAEVVHGRWVKPYINCYGHPCHCCSVCGFKASHQDKNYCSNCGAKMDGGVNDGL